MSKRRRTRRIAICVDDFGLHDGVNQAVLRLAGMQRLNAVGCMVGAPGWRLGHAALDELDRERIDIGLHLDLTEHPIDRALRLPLGQLIMRAYARRLDRARVAREIAAQLDAFEAATGRRPDYVDGHQHVHQLPVIRGLLLDALQQRADPAGRRPWLRRTLPPPALRAGLKPRVIGWLGAAALGRAAQAAGLAQNAHLLGVYDFAGDAARYRGLLARWLAAAGDGDLLMCHPSLAAGTAHDALIETRTREYDQLAAPLFSALLANERIVLEPIRRIVAEPIAN
ncbi:MAG: ChbG/HpnK family deacetylase [Proteobacteria bacterium]|nr:ChbG/HpnK family deacetylase [Pseudomonadota bacterium]